MKTTPRFALPALGIAILCLGTLLVGCQHNAAADFGSKSKAQQVDALKGSMDQLSPERKKQIAAQAEAMMAAHARQGGPGQAGQNRPPGGSK